MLIARKFLPEIGIAKHEFRFGDDSAWIFVADEGFQAGACQLELRLNRLVSIRRRPDRDRFALPAWARQGPVQCLGDIHFGEDLPLKILVWVEPQKRVGRPRIAVVAGIAAIEVVVYGTKCR